MINNHTLARMNVIRRLHDISVGIEGLRAYICLNEKDKEKIDNMQLDVESIINRLMGVGK
jgi:hypothetical protein